MERLLIFNAEAFAEAIQYVDARNVLMVAAAGNSNNDMDLVNFIPAAYEQVIAVGSVDEDFNKSGFSNYGASLDLTAPGNDTSQRGIISTYPDNNYAFLPGTSQSAPQVAAFAGILYSLKPNLSTRDTKSILINSTDDLGATGHDVYYGHGVINGKKLLQALDNQAPQITHHYVAEIDYASSITITCNITDDVDISGYPIGKLYYKLISNNVTPNQWSELIVTSNSQQFDFNINVNKSSSSISYYFEANDIIPSHQTLLPTTAPTDFYHVSFSDLSPPIISFNGENNDYISANNGTIKFTLSDNTDINVNSIKVIVNNIEYQYPHAILTISNNILSIDISNLNIQPGTIKVEIFVQDTSNNLATQTIMLQQSTEFLVFGPQGQGSPILNSPNPVNPTIGPTKICFQLSQAATIKFELYSMNMQLIKTWDEQLAAGYHDTITWDASNAPNGVYLLMMLFDNGSQKIQKFHKIAVLR